MADGNCLYDACSLAIIGNENLAAHLGCLTSIELYSNASLYASRPLFKDQYEKGTFSSMANAFTMCSSDVALRSMEAHNPELAIPAEAKNNAKNHAFSSFLCILALSSILNVQMSRITQPSLQQEKILRWKWNLCQLCLIAPYILGLSESRSDKLHIIRRACMPIDNLQIQKISERKSRYVPLCEPVPSSPNLDFTLKIGDWNKETTTDENTQQGKRRYVPPRILAKRSGHPVESKKAKHVLTLDNFFKRDSRNMTNPVQATPNKSQSATSAITDKGINTSNTATRCPLKDTCFPLDIGTFVNSASLSLINRNTTSFVECGDQILLISFPIIAVAEGSRTSG